MKRIIISLPPIPLVSNKADEKFDMRKLALVYKKMYSRRVSDY